MKKKIKYDDEKIENTKIADDFLPIPKDLVLKEDTSKTELQDLIREGIASGPATPAESIFSQLRNKYKNH